MTDPIRLVIVNDYELVVRGLAKMLAPYADRIEVVELDAGKVPTKRADIVLYDTFAAAQGKQLDSELVRLESGAERLVVFSWNLDKMLVKEALSTGASGYLSKQLTGEALVEALERICAGETVVSPVVGEGSHPEPVGGDWPGREEGLSERESEVLALITQGLSNQEVADRAFLSINTVKSYIRSTYQKIKATSRTQAVLWGVDHGMDRQQFSSRDRQ